LTVVATTAEAEYSCAILRVLGIDCQHEQSAIDSWRKRGTYARDILVEATQLAEAQRTIRSLSGWPTR
jgi:hypothetical protein